MSNGWPNITKAFNDFIFRDLVYIAGGLLVLNGLPDAKSFDFGLISAFGNSPGILLILVISYSVGLILKEFSSIIGVVSTSLLVTSSNVWFLKIFKTPMSLLYKKFYRLDDEKIMSELINSPGETWDKVYSGGDLLRDKHFQRTQSLMEIGSTLGPPFILSAFLYKKYSFLFIIFGCLLILYSWIKLIQQKHILYNRNKEDNINLT